MSLSDVFLLSGALRGNLGKAITIPLNGLVLFYISEVL